MFIVTTGPENLMSLTTYLPATYYHTVRHFSTSQCVYLSHVLFYDLARVLHAWIVVHVLNMDLVTRVHVRLAIPEQTVKQVCSGIASMSCSSFISNCIRSSSACNICKLNKHWNQTSFNWMSSQIVKLLIRWKFI